jgi:hypothetical protein
MELKVELINNLCSVGRTPGMGFTDEKSSPKRNRLDQCLLGYKDSQRTLLFSPIFKLKALINKALVIAHPLSQTATGD